MQNKNASRGELPTVAICYDFDKTLSPKDMQEFELLPALNSEPSAFWAECADLAERSGMDRILAYMYNIVKTAKRVDGVTVRREDFNRLGKSIELFNGVEQWFDRINAVGKRLGLNVEHYVISAGLKEIVEGTSIAKHFSGIFASEFLYGKYGEPIWPCQAVNYTSKTQYIFRISKGCLDLNDEGVNKYMPNDERRVPLDRFIYIGDSETDIPAMKIVKQGGGASIGVYDPDKRNFDGVKDLLKQGRIDFVMPADYSEGGRLEGIVVAILEKMSKDLYLSSFNREQTALADKLDAADDVFRFVSALPNGNEDRDESGDAVKNGTKELLDELKRVLYESNFVSDREAEEYIRQKKKDLKRLFSADEDDGQQ